MRDNLPMGRFLVIVVLAVVAVYVIRRALRAGKPSSRAPQPPAKPGELVSCAQCGMHLPLAEARAVGDRLYCSDEHARLGPGRG